MRIRIFLFIFIFLILSTFSKAYSYDDDDGAFQIWLTTAQEFKLKDKLKASLEEEFRWGNEAREFYYQHYDLGLNYTLGRYWDIGGGYRHVYELSSGKFKQENEPYVTATLKLKMGNFLFNSRNRFEYRHFDYKSDSWRYRNKFTLKYPFKIGNLGVQPFISDEILFSCFSGTNQFNQNRVSSGLGIDITKNVKAEIYYMLVSIKKPGKWLEANVFGTKLKIEF